VLAEPIELRVKGEIGRFVGMVILLRAKLMCSWMSSGTGRDATRVLALLIRTILVWVEREKSVYKKIFFVLREDTLAYIC
jgi:hypothetical protein